MFIFYLWHYLHGLFMKRYPSCSKHRDHITSAGACVSVPSPSPLCVDADMLLRKQQTCGHPKTQLWKQSFHERFGLISYISCNPLCQYQHISLQMGTLSLVPDASHKARVKSSPQSFQSSAFPVCALVVSSSITVHFFHTEL